MAANWLIHNKTSHSTDFLTRLPEDLQFLVESVIGLGQLAYRLANPSDGLGGMTKLTKANQKPNMTNQLTCEKAQINKSIKS